MRHRLDLETEREIRLERIARMVADYGRGEKLAIIAARYGVAEATVVKWAARFGKTRNRRRRENEAAIAAAYQAGTPIAEITATYGIDRKHVWTVARRNGLPLRQRRQPNTSRTPAPHPEAPHGGREGRGANRNGHRR